MSRDRAALRPGVRRARIAELVGERGSATVEELAARFDASAETIRRDLGALAEAGVVRKVHGGARAVGGWREGPFAERMKRNAAAKRLIADKVARQTAPGELLFIDTGSTTLMVAEALSRVDGLIVVTNSTRIAAALGSGGRAQVHLIGGRYAADNAETLGPMAADDLGRFRAARAIITVGAVDAEAGVTDFDFEEAQIARAMIAHADRVTVVADASKFDRRAGFVVCPLDRLDRFVTNRPPTGALAAALSAARVSVA